MTGPPAHPAISPGRLFALVVAVFLLRGAFSIAIVPPWQHPDEPQHFELAHIFGRQTRLDLDERRDPVLEWQILESMKTHGWWRHYGELEPVPFPDTFDAIRDHVWPVSTSPPVYYLLGAGVLKLTGVETLVGQAYVLRWMALLWASLTVWCIWAGTRLLFGEHVALGTALVTAVYGSLF